MARLFKPKYPKRKMIDGKRVPVLRDGKPVYQQSPKWYVEYTDAQGRPRRVPGFRDKVATDQLKADIERQVEREKVGIINVSHEHLTAQIGEHIEAWIEDMERAGRSREYTRKVESRVERLKVELKWATLSSIQPDSLSRWLAAQRRGGMGQQTTNHYLDSVRAFCNWCVVQRRMEKSPVSCVSKVTVTDPERVRRAFSLEEFRRFLAVSDKRRTIYLTAALTGLRRKELALLQWGDVYLERQPRIELRAGTTKSRRGDVIPLPDQLVLELKNIQPVDPAPMTRVFDSIPKISTFDNDLKRAGIPKFDERGRVLDFHALRNTYGTLLATSGASLQEAKELMRHTDVRLTSNVYTDPKMLNTSGAVDRIPLLTRPNRPEHEEAKRTGTDDQPVDAAISSGISEQLTFPGNSCPESAVSPQKDAGPVSKKKRPKSDKNSNLKRSAGAGEKSSITQKNRRGGDSTRL